MIDQKREHVVGLDCRCAPILVLENTPVRMPYAGTIVQQDPVIGVNGAGFALHVEPHSADKEQSA